MQIIRYATHLKAAFDQQFLKAFSKTNREHLTPVKQPREPINVKWIQIKK